MDEGEQDYNLTYFRLQIPSLIQMLLHEVPPAGPRNSQVAVPALELLLPGGDWSWAPQGPKIIINYELILIKELEFDGGVAAGGRIHERELKLDL